MIILLQIALVGLYYPALGPFFILGTLWLVSLIVILLSVLVKPLRRRWKLSLVALSYACAYIITGITNRFIHYQVEGRGPFQGRLVDASGFPLVVFRGDSGNTDPYVNEVSLFANFLIYFALVLVVVFYVRRRRVKSKCHTSANSRE